MHGRLSPRTWSVEGSRARSAQFTWIVICVYVHGQLKAHVHSQLEVHVHGQLSLRAWSA